MELETVIIHDIPYSYTLTTHGSLHLTVTDNKLGQCYCRNHNLRKKKLTNAGFNDFGLFIKLKMAEISRTF